MTSSNRQKGAENLPACEGAGRPASEEETIARLSAELEQCRADTSEIGAENARVAALYQNNADDVCKALGVKWTPDNKYPTVALDAIAQLKRLKELDAAEAALAASDIGGIYAEFDGLADAIQQMSEHIKELSEELAIAEQRAERAEALATLVSHETATLLVQLASNTQSLAGRADRNERAVVKLWRRDAEEARVLAARIREALNEH